MRFSVFNPDAERRDGLKALLRQIDRRASFHDALDWRSADHALLRFTPHLFVMDWYNGIGAGELRAFVTRHPRLPIAALIDEASPAVVHNLLREGARGVVPRTVDPRLIVRVFEIVLLGGNHAPVEALLYPAAATAAAPSAARLPASMQPAHGAPPEAMSQRSQMVRGLSPRQEQIMRCVHMGSTNKMIARTLGISEGTVKIHLASIFQQLGAPNRAAAVAIYNGWLAAQLQVLQAKDDQAQHNVHGQPCPIPLRARRSAWRYPLSGSNTDALPMAAEPSSPFGEISAMQKRDADGQRPAGDLLPPWQVHDKEDEPRIQARAKKVIRADTLK